MLDIHQMPQHHYQNSMISKQNFYCGQPQVIQLEEVSPPPPRQISSVIDSASSSYWTEDEDEDEESESAMDEGNDEESGEQEEEVACSSYCSSEGEEATPTKAVLPRSDSFQRCMKRILSWRERAAPEKSVGSSCKRKLPDYDESLTTYTDSDCHTSKRSRSSSSTSSSTASFSSSFQSRLIDAALAQRRFSNTSSITSAELEMHPCPACDAFFPTLTSLRAHGSGTGNEACCVAVDYAFEK
ncbi:hypothetical protein CPB83DRAFT_896545 [Crepidotus variabilis]|uniref:Uncharacterized protein n=1 Tax=Crepidotus variabilis TaxID=179855 RepID=A0A9P6JM51_9AGAR|nr:hypothetical protein CPB83DRAFT_896545 [Crepidotus variabilis]